MKCFVLNSSILARAFISVQQRFLFNKPFSASYVIFQEEQTCRWIIRQSEYGGGGGGGRGGDAISKSNCQIDQHEPVAMAAGHSEEEKE